MFDAEYNIVPCYAGATYLLDGVSDLDTPGGVSYLMMCPILLPGSVSDLKHFSHFQYLERKKRNEAGKKKSGAIEQCFSTFVADATL